MWEAYDVKDEKCLWAGVGFTGGIARNQAAPCGAISAAVMALGFHLSCDLKLKEDAKQRRLDVRDDADAVVKGMMSEFGAISCRELVGMDFTIPGEYQRFSQSGVWKEKCNRFVEFIIRKLYELDEKRSSPPQRSG